MSGNHWYHSGKVQILLNSLSCSDIGLSRSRGVIGDYQLLWVGETEEGCAVISMIRQCQREYVAEIAGYDFNSPSTVFDGEKANLYLDIMREAPAVAEALNSRFGDPERYRGHSLNKANRLWANYAKTADLEQHAA